MDEETEVDNILATAKKVDSISAQILLREAYEISYGIHNHNLGPPNSNPFDLVLRRNEESYEPYSPLYRIIKEFRIKDVSKRFGVSLPEFLEMPREMCKLILDLSEEEGLVERTALDSVQNELTKNKHQGR